MNALQKANEDINILFNITDILIQHLRYQLIQTYALTILAYLNDCLTYMRQVATHTMNYVHAAMTNILSPNILPVEELRDMLRHIKSQLPSIIHLPISWDDTLHFYQYLKMHVLLRDGHLYSSSMYLYSTEHNRSKFSTYQSCTMMYQLSIKSPRNT